jgi:hypothetical protein
VSKAEQKEIKLEIGLPQVGFPKSMYFNRFRVEREDGFCLVQFGLFTSSGLADSYSCIFSKDVLQQNQKTLLDYLNRIGRPGRGESAIWKAPINQGRTDVVDIVTMAFRGDMAEICLYMFSFSAATRLGRAGSASEPIPSQPLVLLRCAADIQKQLIVALYEE